MNQAISENKVRRIKVTDSAADIARCLHLTDKYIYPQICASPDDPLWIDYVALSLRHPGSVFSSRNLFIAVSEGRIAGACCVIKGGRSYESDCIDAELCQTEGFRKVKRGYFDPLTADNLALSGRNLVNICVLPEFRSMGLGSALMQKLIAAYRHEDIHLDVLCENAPAIALYEKFGFGAVSSYDGFGINGTIPCMHMVRRSGKSERYDA